MGRWIHTWCPPGHGDDERATVGAELSSLVDPRDPALHHIVGMVMELKSLGVELTKDLVLRVVDHARLAHERQVAAESLQAATADLRVGNRVKIGFSTKVTDRLRVINPEELLAFEPGSFELEKARHAEFAGLRVNGEWFKYEGSLVGHVQKLQTTMSAAA